MAPGTARTVPPGPTLHQALAEEVARLQGGDPLAPVTVVVPSRRAGLAARRSLGATSPTGIANVRFVTATWLAELVAGPALAAQGRRPLSEALAREALRAALATGGWPLGTSAENPRTLDALAATFARLRALPPEALAAVVGDKPPWLLQLFAATAELLHAHHSDGELLVALRAAVAAGAPSLAELGPVVAWCPRPAARGAARLLDALGPALTVLTADPTARLAPTALLTATDPDQEVHAVVRQLLRWAEEGVPWHRMAVAYPAAQPYAALVHQHLAAAGIAHNGPTTATLAATEPGRLLLGALALAGGPLPRAEVMAWLASAPVTVPRTAGGPPRGAPAARWDAVSRRAGVVEGVEQWAQRLDALADHRQGSHDRGGEQDQAPARALAAFIAELARALQPPATGTPWAAWSAWADALFTRYAPPAWRRRRADPPEDPRLAAALAATDALHGALAGLEALDEIGSPPTLGAFRDAVTAALDAPFGRLGEFGTGVFVVPLHEAATLALDAVAVVGAVEGRLPGRVSADPVLDATTATRLEAWLGTAAEHTEAQRVDLVAAVAAGARHRLVSFPRAELRSNRHHLPSRWLLAAVAELAGRRVSAHELLTAPPGELPFERVASYAAGLTATPPVSAQERRVAALAAAGTGSRHHPAAQAHPGLGRGLTAVRQRAVGELGPYTGRVDPALVPVFRPEHPMSPTALEHDAACPRRYFLDRLLGVDELDRPEAIEELAPLERGNLVHEVLERYVRGLLPEAPPLPRTPERLLEVAEEVFAAYEAQGLTGRTLGWAATKRALRRDLLAVHARDTLTPVAVELPFGLNDESSGEPPSVELALADGATVAFRGRIDRVDTDAAGELVVTDYKTGSDSAFTHLAATTVEGGTRLQLPIYALAAQQALHHPGPVSAWYWFVSAKGKYRRRGYTVDAERLAVFTEAVNTLAAQVRAGLFPGRPERPVPGRQPVDNCRTCAYSPMCPAERQREWAGVSTAPDLAPYVALSPATTEPVE